MWGCLLILVALCPLRTDAEGSASIFPSVGVCDSIFLGGSCRANVEWRNDTYGPPGSSIQRRTLFYVFAKQGETLYLGSTARNSVGPETDLSDILVYQPGRVTGTKGSEVIPALADLSCRTSQPSVGRIASHAEELAGPQVPGNASGYAPCTYAVTTTGIYNVIMYGPAGSNSRGDGVVSGDITLSSGLDQEQAASIAGWDISVRSDSAPTIRLDGRVFTYAIAANTGANDRPVYMTYYVVILDGYRYKVQTEGMDPNGWLMLANQLGFVDTDGISPLYHNVRGTNQELSNLIGGVNFAEPQYPLFFSPADDDTLVALNIPIVPTVATISDFTFTGSSLSTTSYNAGGTFSFTSNVQAVYEIVLSPNSNFDPTLPTNRVLRGAAPLGSHSVAWNGRDNAGNAFALGSYQARATIHGGEYHFPFIDVENNVRGGPHITLINGPCPSWIGGCTGAFYDDRGYKTSNGYTVGVVNGALCPSQPSSASNPLIGFDTTANIRSFGHRAGNANVDCLGAFGDAKGLDLWTYTPSAPMQASVFVLDRGITGHLFRDLDDNGVQDAGEPDLAGHIVEITNGAQSAIGVTDAQGNYAIQLPAGAGYMITVNAVNAFVSTNNNPQGPLVVAVLSVVAAAPIGLYYEQTPSPTSAVLPVIGGTPSSSAVVGQSYFTQFSATGAPAPQFSLTSPPSWMSIDALTGQVFGTPDTIGTYTIGVTAYNVHGSNSLTYNLVVDGYAPTITGVPNLIAIYGTPYSTSFTIGGFPSPAISIAGPAWISLSSNGVVSGTPTDANSSLVEVYASNAYGNATYEYTLDVVGLGPGLSGTPASAVINTPYSYQFVVSGFPVPVLNLQGPAWLSLSPSGVLSGTPNATGTFNFQIIVTNSLGSTPQSYSIFVSGIPPSITSSAPPSSTLGSPYNFTVTATGTPSPTFTLSGIPGLSIDPTTGVISGSPSQAGIFSLVITVSNGYGSDSVQTSSISIGSSPPTMAPAAPTAPHITSTPVLNAFIGSLYQYTLTATGNPVPTFTIVSGPNWLSLNGNVIQGTPQPSDDGSIVMIIRADNAISPYDLQTFRLTVATVAPTPIQAPIITSTAPVQAYLGVNFSYSITFIGESPVFILAAGLPDWLNLEGCCTLVGTPTQLGLTNSIVLTASNGHQPNGNQLFQIHVVPAPTAAPTKAPSSPPSPQPTAIVSPVFTSSPETSATIGAPYIYYITTLGHPTPTVTTRLSDLPSWLHFNSNTNTLSGIPTSGTAGAVAVSLTASNGIYPNATQVFILTVSNIPSAPSIVSSAPLSGAVGSLYVYQILTSGSPYPNISFTGPNFLTLQGGILVGTPNATGNFSVTIVASNGIGGVATQVFTLSIGPAPTGAPTPAPTAAPVPVTFQSVPGNVATSGAPYTYTIIATGSPYPQFSLSGAPSWLTLTNDTISGTPPSSLTGTLTFRILANNGILPAASQLVTIQLNPTAFTSPVIISNATTTVGSGEFYTYVVSATGFPAPVFLWTLPNWLTVSSSNAITGRPPVAGVYSVSVRASNGLAPADVQIFEINVYQSTNAPTPVGTVISSNGQISPSITSIPPTTAFTGLTYTYVVNMTGTPNPFLTPSALPTWLSLSGNTISGTVPAVITGSIIFGLTASNGANPPATQTVLINFADPPAPRITSLPIASAHATQQYKYVITATGSPAPDITTGPLPSWLTLSNDGVLSGIPPAGTTGISSISISASNNVSTAQQNFSLTVTNTAIAPTITSQPRLIAVVGSSYSYEIVTTGNPLPDWNVIGNPSWLVRSGNLLSGVVPQGTGTLPTITVTANNTVSTFTQRFAITIVSLPVVGAAQSQPEKVPYGMIYNAIYPVSGSPVPTLSISDNPPWLSLTGRTVTGIPPLSALGSVACYTLTATNSAGSSRKTVCFDVILPSQEACQDGLQRIHGELDYLSRVATATCPNAPANSSAVSLCHAQCDNPVAYVTNLILANGFLGRRLLASPFNSTDEEAIATTAASTWGLAKSNVYTLGSEAINLTHTSVKVIAVAPERFAFTPVTTVGGRPVAQASRIAAAQSDFLDLLALLMQKQGTPQSQVTGPQPVLVDDTTPWWVYFLLVILIISFLCWAIFCFGVLRSKDKARAKRLEEESANILRNEGRKDELDGKHNEDDKSEDRLRLQQQLQALLDQKRHTLAEIHALQAEIQREQENRLLEADQFEQEREVSRLLKQMVELEATQQKQHAAQIAALNTEIATLKRAGADRSTHDSDSGVQDQIRELGSAYQELKREQELQKSMQIKEQKKLLDTVENLSRALEKSRGEGDGLRERLDRERREREAVEQAVATERARAEKERAERAREKLAAERSEKDRLERERLEGERLRLQNERERIELGRQQREKAAKSSSPPQGGAAFNFSDDSGFEDDSGGSDGESLHFPKGAGLNEDDVDMAKFSTLAHADKGVLEQWKAREAHAQAVKAKEKRKKARQLARREARHLARREAKAAAARAGQP